MTILKAIQVSYSNEANLSAKRLLRELIVTLRKDGRGFIEIPHISLQFGKRKRGLGVDLSIYPQYANCRGDFDFKEPSDLFSNKIKTNCDGLKKVIEYEKEDNNEILYVPELYDFNMYKSGHKERKSQRVLDIEYDIYKRHKEKRIKNSGKVRNDNCLKRRM